MELEECGVCQEPLWKSDSSALDNNQAVELVCQHLIHHECWTNFVQARPVVHETSHRFPTGACPVCRQGTTMCVSPPSKFETKAFWKHHIFNSIESLGPADNGALRWITLKEKVLSSFSDEVKNRMMSFLNTDIRGLENKIDKEIFNNKHIIFQVRNEQGDFIGTN